MLWLVPLLFFFAETPQEYAARVRAQMQASVSAQRESVRRQAESAPHPARHAIVNAWTPRASILYRDPPGCDPVPEPELAGMVDSAAKAQSLNPFLIREVARQESGFRPCAVSRQGAAGVMQLMPITQIELGVSDPWNARQSIDAGSQLLRQLLDRYHGD